MPRKSVAANEATVEQRIAPAVRRFRRGAGLSLRTLAAQVGFSASFMSQVENGLVSPSIASLEKIASALGVTLTDLLAAPSATEIAIVRGNARPTFRSSWSKARLDALTPLDGASTLEALMVTLDGGGSSGKHPSSAGVDQFAMALKGRLTLTHGVKELELTRGDAVLIRANTPRRWHNAGRQSAQVLLVSTRRR